MEQRTDPAKPQQQASRSVGGISPPERRSRLCAPEFYNWQVVLTIALFALNNLVLKSAFPGWLTGKLSDILFCFFFPLYCSALLALIGNWPLRNRLYTGAALTAISLVGMKSSTAISAFVTEVLTAIAGLLGIQAGRNIVDPTDLIAIPVIALSLAFGLHRGRRRARAEN